MPDIREASPQEATLVKPVSLLLARCFTDDPWIGYIVPPSSPSRTELIARFFEPTVRSGLLSGRLIVTTPSLIGAAVCLGPGHAQLFEQQIESAGGASLCEMMGSGAFARVMRWSAITQAFHEEDLAREHWYLALLGVDADQRRRGIGESLVRPLIKRADADRLPMYLETSEEKNLQFYKRLGFVVVRQGTDAVGSFPYWSMVRQPVTTVG